MGLDSMKALALSEMGHRGHAPATICDEHGCETVTRRATREAMLAAEARQRAQGAELQTSFATSTQAEPSVGSTSATESGSVAADAPAPEHAPAPSHAPAAERSPIADPIISVTDVSKRYQLGKENHVYALRGASIDIASGEMVAIVGPSGSGKSTMMHLVGCLDTPDTGEVWLNGRRVDTLSGSALTKLRGQEVGFIFQGFNLVPTMNAVDNVALAAEYAGTPRREALDRARELLALVGLGDRIGHLPSELSGGQQQRVAIARALVNSPSIILGDEPTGDLDTATSDEIVAVMRKINLETGTTFVLVTHNPEVAAACDRTIRMRDGQVEDLGFGEVDAAVETIAPRAPLTSAAASA